MKFAIVLMALFAITMANPLSGPPAALLKHEELHDENTYTVEYQLDDGTVVKERGVKVAGPEGDVWHKSGSYRFTSPEGVAFEVTYNADNNGYLAHGDHLPKSPVV